MAFYIKSTSHTTTSGDSSTPQYIDANNQWTDNISDKKTFDTESAATAFLENGYKNNSTVLVVEE